MPRPARPGPDLGQEARRHAPRCPGCGTQDVEVISLFGQQAITLQYRCRRCGTPFEALKYEDEDETEDDL
jgi:ring-1,2-phenylacetyl-CoA epoxidase subunit PaaD